MESQRNKDADLADSVPEPAVGSPGFFLPSTTEIETVGETWLPTERLHVQASLANNSGHETKF